MPFKPSTRCTFRRSTNALSTVHFDAPSGALLMHFQPSTRCTFRHPTGRAFGWGPLQWLCPGSQRSPCIRKNRVLGGDVSKSPRGVSDPVHYIAFPVLVCDLAKFHVGRPMVPNRQNQVHFLLFIHGHRTSKAPHPVRSAQLTGVPPS